MTHIESFSYHRFLEFENLTTCLRRKRGWRRRSSDCVDFLLTQSCLSQWWTWAKFEGSTSKVTSFEASNIVNSIVVDYHGGNKDELDWKDW